MSKRNQRVNYHLDRGEITHPGMIEIKAILRAADELIATGGRTMLSKILKGSKDKKLLEHKLDRYPAIPFAGLSKCCINLFHSIYGVSS